MNPLPVVWVVSLSVSPLELRPFPLPASELTLDDISAALPAGAYTTLRTYQGERVIRLSDHLHRLELTAGLTGRPMTLDNESLRAILRQAVQGYHQGMRPQAPVQDLRLRLTLDLEIHPGDLYLALQPLSVPPPEYYQRGVAAITCDLQRLLPEAKLTRFIDRSQSMRQRLTDGLNEAVMVNPQGYLLEGLSSNFFAVFQGAIWTADEGVLAGVTRSLVLECIRRLQHPLRLQALHRTALPEAQEAFITSSSRGILPLRRIDTIAIGTECPGPLTRRLMLAFDAILQEQAEPI